ncbi:UbiA family prenyltransferase [Diaphorobacter ruginosibacter]|uniref:UbiA family prenyltransferase n=1 Tax=Diaphorobacter ruginosibacter TaxID=1715720 RepID=UPI00333E4DBA
MTSIPLVVDLDGTLIHTDMLHETALKAARNAPLSMFSMPGWLAQGKAALKKQLAGRSHVDPALLPYNEELINWLQQEKAQGRRIVLCTASDQGIAESIARHLKLFDDVLASDGAMNMAGRNKARILADRYGVRQFDYVGNSSADLAVWQVSRKAVVVNASDGVLVQAQQLGNVQCAFPARSVGLEGVARMLRVHQWLKNLLLFIPLLAAHEWFNVEAMEQLLVAFFSFNLCASSVYIANDLLDLDSDRMHPRKRNRPFASGLVPVWYGVAVAPLLLVVSAVLAAWVGWAFLAWLAVYFALTCAYSWTLKRLILVDCLTLALLYTLRIVAGAAAIQMGLSFWLLAFSVFLFLSLAFVKRYAEIELQVLSGKEKLHGRGYLTTDAPLIQTMGITAGYSSVLVLALYLNSDAVSKLYASVEIVWVAVPVMIFWVSWMWMQAHRGNMHDDPLVFAMKDRTSLAAGLVFAGVLAAGTTGVSWAW